MPVKVYNGIVATGEYTDNNGAKKKRWKTPIEIFRNDKGEFYGTVDPFFNFAAVPREANSDKVFVVLRKPDNNNYRQ